MVSSGIRIDQGARAIAMLMFGAALLAGCGGSGGEAGSGAAVTVASVARPSAEASKPSSQPASGDDARPVVREDASAEEEDRLFDAYYDCLVEHGSPKPKGHGKPPAVMGGPKYDPILRACAPKLPEDYIDRLKRQDRKDFDDRAKAFHQCMRDKGLKTVVAKGKDNPDNDPFVYGFAGAEPSVTRSLDVGSQCKTKAFRSASDKVK